jgi:hypothetical protein
MARLEDRRLVLEFVGVPDLSVLELYEVFARAAVFSLGQGSVACQQADYQDYKSISHRII